MSVLIAARDAATTLPVCLRSVARQTLPDCTPVVVEDDSPDGDVVATRNRGIDLCDSEWTAILDSDDWMHRQRLERQVDYAEAHGLDGVGCHVRRFGEPGGEGDREYIAWLNSMHTSADLLRDRFVEMPVAHPSLLLRTELLREHRYRNQGWPEDWDLLLRLLQAKCALGVLPERLLAWRARSGSLSRTGQAYTLAAFMRCRAHHLAGQFLRDRKGFVLWGYGQTGKALRRALLPLGYRPTHIVEVHPRRLGQSIHGAPVVPPHTLRDPSLRPILVSVAGAVPRARIRAECARLGLRDGVDFVCCA